MKITFKVIAVGFAMISILFLSACNTTKGLGKDISKGGQAIERAAS
jgi:entericidin B